VRGEGIQRQGFDVRPGEDHCTSVALRSAPRTMDGSLRRVLSSAFAISSGGNCHGCRRGVQRQLTDSTYRAPSIPIPPASRGVGYRGESRTLQEAAGVAWSPCKPTRSSSVRERHFHLADGHAWNYASSPLSRAQGGDRNSISAQRLPAGG